MSRAEQYYHWLLRSRDWRTYAPARATAKEVGRTLAVESAPPAAVLPAELAQLAERFAALDGKK